MKNKHDINKIFQIFHSVNPYPRIELEYHNSYTLLVAVLLSAQSTDKMVNRVTSKLFKVIDNPKAMIELGLEGLIEYIRSIGLYNSKSCNIINLSKKLVSDSVAEIPNDFDYLLSLPGIGRKSASVILNSYYNEPYIGVDTHVHRVSNRIGLVKTKNAHETEKSLYKCAPIENRIYVHHWLVLHGRYVCKARNPECDKCIVRGYCAKYRKDNKRKDS
ncbi:MAG: endonuclease III [Candidatus Xenolissoclinum pacificiensis L6]|uniref:Endonuclease III n=1 Tax=Candidatus Xenolissoclinum pacificiensis L6 TaxID=1401685 RepID=W2UZH4_9RICK|nr:MAG: endonuclease III [Candidatus Xenolissoclinum pacificiensis L6]